MKLTVRLAIFALFIIFSCSKKLDTNFGTTSVEGAVFVVNATVSGLTTGQIVLTNIVTSETKTITADGSYQVGANQLDGSAYDIDITTQPVGQVCSLSNDVGNISAANATVTISCSGDGKYRIGGSLTGLASAQSVVLQNNGGDDLTLSADGTFEFATGMLSGKSYFVTVKTHPTGQLCTTTNGSGTTTTTSIGNITVSCANIPAGNFIISGTVSGLSGSGLTIQNNLADDTTIGSDGSFTIINSYINASSYNITISAQPQNRWQTCTATNNIGTISSANVTNVSITCVTDAFKVGGSVNGLAGAEVVGLQLTYGAANTVEALNVTGSGSPPDAFTSIASVTSGDSYAIAVVTPPAGKTCILQKQLGTMAGADVTDVAISCYIPQYNISGTVSGLWGSGLTLTESIGGDTQSINVNGYFKFANKFNTGISYNVSITQQPGNPTQLCTLTGATVGAIASQDITSLVVTCVLSTFDVSGQVSGLASGESIGLRLTVGTSTEDIIVNGAVTTPVGLAFTSLLPDTSPYAVTINGASPVGKICNVAVGTGTINNAIATNVQVNCGVPTTVTGSVDQAGGGNNGGTTLYVRLYGSSTEFLNHLAQLPFSLTDTVQLTTAQPFTFTNVPPGTYYVRAFRDTGSNANTTSPDGQPTIGVDDQSVVTIGTAGTSFGTIQIKSTVCT